MADGDEGGGEGTVGPTSIAIAEPALGAGSAGAPRLSVAVNPGSAGATGVALSGVSTALRRRVRLHAGTPVVRRGRSI